MHRSKFLFIWCFCQNNLGGFAQMRWSPAKAHFSPKTVCQKESVPVHQYARSLWHCIKKKNCSVNVYFNFEKICSIFSSFTWLQITVMHFLSNDIVKICCSLLRWLFCMWQQWNHANTFGENHLQTDNWLISLDEQDLLFWKMC